MPSNVGLRFVIAVIAYDRKEEVDEQRSEARRDGTDDAEDEGLDALAGGLPRLNHGGRFRPALHVEPFINDLSCSLVNNVFDVARLT